jgi:hemerythrin superfamily protein
VEQETKKWKDEIVECEAEKLLVKEYVHDRKESLQVTQMDIQKCLKNDEKSIEKMESMVMEAQRSKLNIL